MTDTPSYRVVCADCDYDAVVEQGAYASDPEELARKKKAGHISGTAHDVSVRLIEEGDDA